MNVLMLRASRAAIDLVVITLALVVATMLRFDLAPPDDAWVRLVVRLPYVVLLKYALLSIHGVYRHSWRYTGLREVTAIVRAMVASSAIVLVARLVAPALTDTFPGAGYAVTPYVVVVLDLALTVLGLVGVRVLRRLQSESREAGGRKARNGRTQRRVLLIGAGRAGVMVSRELQARPDLGIRAIGFVDDDPQKRGQVLNGLKVLGRTRDIERLVADHKPDEAIITMARVDSATIRRIVALCEDAGVETKIIPGVYEIVGGFVNLSRIRPVGVEDLLGRDPIDLDLASITDVLRDEAVMVTGAGGSIGSELCRQIARFEPSVLVLFEQAEMNLWAIQEELKRTFPDVLVVSAIGDVCDAARVDDVLAEYKPSTIFHAAAHKHVPIMERNPGEAIKNNVFGTRTVVDLATQHDVTRFVMVSTDKAVNPTSVMGATKRVAERYVQHVAHETGRAYVSVRFGNVLDSSGSVIPVFKDQIARGGPVTVTHPEMRRYFMTIPEASQLVLQAGAMGTGGEVFVLDMGEPVLIDQLARDLIRLSGLVPDRDIEIVYSGIRPGEKLFEELHLTDENADRTSHPKVFIGRGPDPSWPAVDHDLEGLLGFTGLDDGDVIRGELRRLIPEFVPTGELPDVSALLAAAQAAARQGKLAPSAN